MRRQYDLQQYVIKQWMEAVNYTSDQVAIVRVVNCRLRWAAHVVRMGTERNE
jgi:hypothetical protein